MKINNRLFLSWILSSISMFLLFYYWHGVFLNDLTRIKFPLTWFITFAAFTYLILGIGMYALYESRLMKPIKNFLIRGLLCGLIAGFTVFMMATIVNISLTSHLTFSHLIIDCAWQITEQILGAMIVVILKILSHEPVPENA